jgi:hypothetical protein
MFRHSARNPRGCFNPLVIHDRFVYKIIVLRDVALARVAVLACVPVVPSRRRARIAMNETNAHELRARLFPELAGYVAP